MSLNENTSLICKIGIFTIFSQLTKLVNYYSNRMLISNATNKKKRIHHIEKFKIFEKQMINVNNNNNRKNMQSTGNDKLVSFIQLIIQYFEKTRQCDCKLSVVSLKNKQNQNANMQTTNKIRIQKRKRKWKIREMRIYVWNQKGSQSMGIFHCSETFLPHLKKKHSISQLT